MQAWLDELRSAQRREGLGVGRPFVTAAFAQSLDGCLAQTQGTRTFLSGESSGRLTHMLRAMHDAVLVGVGTVLSDDPVLTTRLVEGPNPRRIVLDSRLRTPKVARLLTADDRPALVFGSEPAPPAAEAALRAAGAEVIRVPAAAEGVALVAVLRHVLSLGVQSVMVEGGAGALESFFDEGLIDHLCITDCPVRLNNACAVRLPDRVKESLAQWQPAVRYRLGNDWVRAGPFPGGQADR